MVYIMLAPGFEEMEAIIPCDLLRRAGIAVSYVGTESMAVTSARGVVIQADCALSQVDLTDLEMVVLPGGRMGVCNLQKNQAVLDILQFAWENRKFVAAVCAAPTILASLHITDHKQVTCYPDPCWTEQMKNATLVEDAASVRDDTVITGTSAGCSVAFGLELIAALRGEETAAQVRDGIVIR